MGLTLLLLFLFLDLQLDNIYILFWGIGGELVLCALMQVIPDGISSKKSKEERKYYLIDK